MGFANFAQQVFREHDQQNFAYQMELIIKRNKGDIERAHSEAGELMCNTLKRLGYTKGIEIFEEADFPCA